MVSNVAEQCTQPSSKSLSYAQKQNIILFIALVSGHNSRYSIQVRRKRQCSFLPPLKQRGIHYTFNSASLWTHDLYCFYDMKFPKDGTPYSRSSTADKALKGKKFAVFMPLTPLTPSLPVFQIFQDLFNFPLNSLPSFQHWWAEDLSDSVMHISQLIHGETSSCLLVFLTVPSKTTFPLVACSRYYAFALFFNQLSCCRSWLYCRSQARHIAPINGCEMAYKVWK